MALSLPELNISKRPSAFDGIQIAFQKCFKEIGEGKCPRKLLHTLLTDFQKEEFVSWKDEKGLDAVHYAIMYGSAEAVDFIFKNGHFLPPYEPQVNSYAHFAASLGYRRVLCTVLQYRPEDFKVSHLPLFIPAGCPKLRRESQVYIKQRSQSVVPLDQIPSSKHVQSWSRTSLQFFRGGRDSIARRISGVFFKSPLSSVDTTVSNKNVNFIVRGHHPHLVYSGPRGMICESKFPRSVLKSVEPLERQNTLDKSKGHALTFEEAAQSQSESDITGVRRRSTSMPATNAILGSKNSSTCSVSRRNSIPIRDDSKSISLSTTKVDTIPPKGQGTPLQVASASNHVDCVKALLDMFVGQAFPEYENKGYLALAVLANDIATLKLLISIKDELSDVPLRKDEYKAAVEVALNTAASGSLNILLNEDLVDLTSIYTEPTNFYHIMYCHPKSPFNALSSSNRVPATTSLLIRRGYDVTQKTPIRTYALYSLIEHAIACNVFSYSEPILACLRLLLHNGADPNFDEIALEQSDEAYRHHPTQRHAFSSAFHCLFESIIIHKGRFHWKTQAIHFVEECMEILLAFGADIQKVGLMSDNPQEQVVGNALMQYFKACVTYGVDRGLLNRLIRFGALPQHKVDGKYPLTFYIEKLLAIVKSDDEFLERQRELEIMVTHTCSYLAPWHLKEVLRLFNSRHRASPENASLVGKITQLLVKETLKVRSLRFISAWLVWKMCDMKEENVKCLPVSKDFKNNILPLVLFQTMW